MAYTIVGMFPTNEEAEQAANQLSASGFGTDDFHVSGYSTTGDLNQNSVTDYEEDEKTSGFWNWLFGDEEDNRKRYSYAGTKSNVVTVYADNMQFAEKARDVMNESGAIDVNEFTKDRFSTTENSGGNELSERERARIISKAKNNLYMTDNTRSYSVGQQGMSNDMDHQGTKDTF